MSCLGPTNKLYLLFAPKEYFGWQRWYGKTVTLKTIPQWLQ